jgi:YVTN family beta-propeller protein
MSDRCRFGILGPLEVARNGETIEIPPGKPRALLVLLLLDRGKVVPVDRLVEELWDERPPPSATKQVQVYVARLRKLLGDGLLVTSSPGYALRLGDEQLDAARFESLVETARSEQPSAAAKRLREALALWRGPPLVDFSYDSWAQEEIRRLEELHLEALEDRIEADLALGRHEEVVGEIESLARAHPLRERLQAQLMLALYRCGRQAEALAAFQSTRRRFLDELGLEPSPPLQQLEQAILRHDASLAAPERTEPRPRPEQAAAPRRRVRRPSPVVLVGAGALVLAALALAIGNRVTGGSRALSALPNSVGVIDGDRNSLHATVAAHGTPGGIAAGAGAVWVSDTAADAVLRIEPSGRSAQRIPVGNGPAGVAFGDGQVWVVDQLDRAVSEVSPSALKEVGRIPVGNGPSGIAYGHGSIWVANTTDDTLSRLDPKHGRVLATIALGGAPEGIAIGKRAVWVTSAVGQLLLVDPGTNRVVQAYSIGNGPQGVAVGKGAVWVANTPDGTVSRFDVGTGNIKKIPVGTSPHGVAYGSGAVWVANGVDGTVSRIDPLTRSVRQIRIGNEPSAVTTVGKNAWVTVLSSPSSHRGGVLHVIAGDSFLSALGSADPAYWNGIGQWRLLILTNDGLVSYRRLGGLAGDTLVPDLATAIPTPTDGGRTYTFRLRTGIRYSNGVLVKPEDFRRAIERVLRLNYPYWKMSYTGIVGADQCVRRPASCDLSSGIVTDDAANTVTFHLRTADPEFVYKLAYPFADAIPPGTPERTRVRTPPPATGPYMTASFSAGKSWILRRNPHFREWSADAQPDGYPDRIAIRVYSNPQREVDAIEHGDADVLLGLPPNRVRELATRYASQFHSDPFAATYSIVMNTRVPPFDRVAVRRALNYAIDRGRIVEFAGGQLVAQPTCQILAPTLPGYRPYCPYTLNPSSSGAWTAPDVARAERLVAASGTRGMRVTFWIDTSQGGPVHELGHYIVSVLDRLGYKASLRWVSTVIPGAAADSRTHAQLGWFTWLQDHPSPSNFIDPLLSCRSFVRASEQNGNLSEFCDPTIDRQMQRAYSLQTHDPGAANALWGRIDHELVDRAPWLPLYNPRVLTALSARAGNYQYHPFWQVLLDQLWVR